MNRHLSIKVQDASIVGEVRRNAIEFAKTVFSDEVKIGEGAIAATELASNLAKHAREGTIHLYAGHQTLAFTAIDSGPGMTNPSECMRDGFSTSGTTGTGLGSVKRLADEFDFFTVPGQGTVMHAAFYAGNPNFQLGAISVPFPGEIENGDAWDSQPTGTGARFMVVDGLGHGVLAEASARAAVEAFQENARVDNTQLMNLIHGALRITRGAAVSLAQLSRDRQTVNYAGVGNVAGLVQSPEATRRMISYAGTVGLQIRKFQDMTYPMETGAVMVMHTDGVSGSWSIKDYPGLLLKHAGVIAGVLFRDFARNTDDATLIAVRMRG